MKIEVNPTDYRRLLMMLSIADWVLNAHESEESTGFRRMCAESTGRFLRHADAMGCGDCVEELDEGELTFSTGIEEQHDVRDAIEEYDSQTFWTDLVSRLAERDYERAQDRPAVSDSEFPETEEEAVRRLDELDRLEAAYWREFEENGIENLQMLRGGGRLS